MAGKLDSRGIAGMLFDHGADALEAFADMVESGAEGDASEAFSAFFRGDWFNGTSLRMAGYAEYLRMPKAGMPARAITLARQIRERDCKAINRSGHQLRLANTAIISQSGITFSQSYNTDLTRKAIPVLVSAMTLEFLGRNAAIHKLPNLQHLQKPYDLETLLKLAATCRFDMHAINRYDIGRDINGTNTWLVQYTETDGDSSPLYSVEYDGKVRLARNVPLPDSVIQGLIGKRISAVIQNPYWDLLDIRITAIGNDNRGRYLQTDANAPRNLYVLDNPMEHARDEAA